MSIVVTFKLRESTLRKLNEWADRLCVSRSKLIKVGIEMVLKKLEAGEPVGGLNAPTKWRVKRVVLSPPNEPDEVDPPQKPKRDIDETCREIAKMRESGFWWSEIAEALGFTSSNSANRFWYEKCKPRGWEYA